MPRSCKNYDFENQEGLLPKCTFLFSGKNDPLSHTTNEIINYHFRSVSNMKRKLSKNSSQKGIKLTLSKKKKNQSINTLDSTQKTQTPISSHKTTKSLLLKNNQINPTNKTFKKLKDGIISSRAGTLMEEKNIKENGEKSNSVGKVENQEKNIDLRFLGLLSPNQTTSNSSAKLQTIEEICGSSQYQQSLCKFDRCKASISSLAVEQFKTNYHHIDVYQSEKVSRVLIHEPQNPQLLSIIKVTPTKQQPIKQLYSHARDTQTILSGSQTSQLTVIKDDQIEMSSIISFSRSLFTGNELKEYRRKD